MRESSRRYFLEGDLGRCEGKRGKGRWRYDVCMVNGASNIQF